MGGMDGAVERLKVCLNGKRSQREHPAVPVTPAELAREAAAAVSGGAEAIHLHARGPDGAESVRAEHVGAAVAAVRQACPATPVGVSTGLWITAGDAAARHRAVASWAELAGLARPDFASVNACEDGWAELARLLAGAGIAVEAGVWSVDDVRAAADGATPDGLLRVMVEVMNATADEAVGVAWGILGTLDKSPLRDVPRLLHGEEAGCWPLVGYAGRLGLATRIGLEDTLAGPGGEPVAGNAELVRLALAVLDANQPGARM
jgi:uncharacterized protein (DUF849 family)